MLITPDSFGVNSVKHLVVTNEFKSEPRDACNPWHLRNRQGKCARAARIPCMRCSKSEGGVLRRRLSQVKE